MKHWYHCYIPAVGDLKAQSFGFATNKELLIIEAPKDFDWMYCQHIDSDDFGAWTLDWNAEIVFVATQL